MSTISGFPDGDYASHDGGEVRADYDTDNTPEPVDSLTFDDLDYDSLEVSRASHTLSVYHLEGVFEGRRYEITVTESGEPSPGASVRASPVDEGSTEVYRARTDVDPQFLLEEGDEALDSQVLERSY